MAQKMLIDASHPEETRVVAVDGPHLIDFDFETSTKKQLRGNIYLAKVTRVEPSLQAAFVDYGGNRHGFLAFSEIHPDYYQIPVADREALEREAEVAERALAGEHDAGETAGSRPPAPTPPVEAETAVEDTNGSGAAMGPAEEEGKPAPTTEIEVVGGEEFDESERRQRVLARIQVLRRYRIQEVIRKRQILLVQVVKEERGTKGAALTTYISLAGRYCVLMPNTPRGGGISRKIADAGDRKRLKTIMSELSIDSRMGLILRTAGLAHSKAEIKRDFDYLTRLWDDIRERTLKSSAPCLIHEEGNLIKRAVRDLYTRDTQEILVEGEEAYKTAKDFMRMMMPSHAARVKQFTERVPLFQRFQVEAQLDALHRDTVPLRSGAYIVLNPTEALVAIDVNSGRATKERNIEETATKTNLEAADEIARQLRLRDLAGLIVIDFIDMNEAKNDRLVEKRLKEAVKTDRARIQLGRISPFGLLELSRQRLRPSLLEANTERCATCVGSGRIRSVESSALQALRAIESGALREEGQELSVTVPTKVAFYLLNQKRASLNLLEARYGLHITVHCDDTMVAPACRIERLRGAPTRRAEAEAEPAAPGAVERVEAEPAEEEPVAEVAEEPMAEVAEEPAPVGEEAPRRRRRRGRRGGRRHRREGEPAVGGESEAPAPGSAPEARPSGGDIDRPETEEPEGEEVGQSAAAPHRAGQPEGTASTTEGSLRRRRRRRRRGGQRPASEEGAASAAPPEPASISGAREPHGAATSQEPRPEIDAMPPRERASEVDEFAGATRGEPVLPALIGDNAAQPVEDLEASGTRARRPAKRGWWQRLQKGSTESD